MFDVVQNVDSTDAIVRYIQEARKTQCVLTYCHKEFVEALKAQQVPHKLIDEDVEHEFLERRLEEVAEDGGYPLLVADNCDIAMRGLNYRGRTRGILLLVQRPFKHWREAQQAAYRVGRNDDPCRRQILPDVELVDDVQSTEYKCRLGSWLRTAVPQEISARKLTDAARKRAATEQQESKSNTKIGAYFKPVTRANHTNMQ